MTDSERRHGRGRWPDPVVAEVTRPPSRPDHRDKFRPKSNPCIPLPQDESENTDPYSIAMQQGPSQRDYDAVRRSGREPDSPVKAIEFSHALHVAKEQLRAERRSAEEAAMRKLEELLDRAPRDIAEKLADDIAGTKQDIAALKEFVGHQRAALKWVAGFLLGSVITVAGFLYWRGFGEGSAAVRLQRAEDDIKGLQRHNDRDRRNDFPPFPTTKGQQP